MKVLHVIPEYDDSWGGPAVSTKKLNQSLILENIESDIVSTTLSSSQIVEIDDCTKAFPVTLLKFWRYSPTLSKYLELNISKYDIVHIHGLWTYPHYCAYRLAVKFNIPFIVRPCGNLENWMLGHHKYRKLLYFQLVTRKMLRRAACIHAVSEQEQKNIQNICRETKVICIPHFIDSMSVENSGNAVPIELHELARSHKKIALFLSRISPQKGLERLIDAWKDVHSKLGSDDWILVIAGQGEPKYEKKIRRRARFLVENGSILFAGFANGSLKNYLFENSEFFVLPSNGENFGIVIGEAAHHGLPIITTNVTPWEMLSETEAGFIIDPNVECLVTALKMMMGMTTETRLRMGKKAQAVTKTFEKSKIVAQIVNLYDSILVEKYC